MMRRARVRYMAIGGCDDVRDLLKAAEGALRETIGVIGSSKVKVKPMKKLSTDICVLKLVLYEPKLIDEVILSIALTNAKPLATSGTLLGLMKRLNVSGYGGETGDEANRPSLNR